MNVQPLHAAPPPELAAALEQFEKQFTYPLGPGRSFRIAHGEDYPRFFRAMGEAACFVAERDGQVQGVVGVALRRLLLPTGTEIPIVYLGDLKIAPAARGGRTLPRLAQAVADWVAGRAAAAFGVIMDGTPVTPARYTGRLGIPLFHELGKVAVLRLATGDDSAGVERGWETDAARGSDGYAQWSAGRYASPGGFPAERSEIEPLWLMGPHGRACGRLEDTRRAKRLIADDGVEMCSAHLSCFAYQDVPAGVGLLQVARRCAGRHGFPALFVAVPAPEGEAFHRALTPGVVQAPATVYGTGLAPGPLWNINTAEI
jgi:hypothetical protein